MAKALFKRCNIVACNIIQHCCMQHVAPFEHPVARCCKMLREVWFGSNFQCNIMQHFYCSRGQWTVSQHVASVWTALSNNVALAHAHSLLDRMVSMEMRPCPARTEIQGGQVCLCLSRTVNFVDLTRDQCRKLPDFEQESSEVPVRFSDVRKRVSCSFRKCWLPK